MITHLTGISAPVHTRDTVETGTVLPGFGKLKPIPVPMSCLRYKCKPAPNRLTTHRGYTYTSHVTGIGQMNPNPKYCNHIISTASKCTQTYPSTIDQPTYTQHQCLYIGIWCSTFLIWNHARCSLPDHPAMLDADDCLHSQWSVILIYIYIYTIFFPLLPYSYFCAMKV